MSTKSSLKFHSDDAAGQKAHLYEELFDDDHVYLELTGFPFEAASSAGLSGQGQARVAIQFPLVWAKKLGLVDA